MRIIEVTTAQSCYLDLGEIIHIKHIGNALVTITASRKTDILIIITEAKKNLSVQGSFWCRPLNCLQCFSLKILFFL